MCRSIKSDPPLSVKHKKNLCGLSPLIVKYVKLNWHETNSSIHKCLHFGYVSTTFVPSISHILNLVSSKQRLSVRCVQVFGLDGFSQTRFRLLSRITFFHYVFFLYLLIIDDTEDCLLCLFIHLGYSLHLQPFVLKCKETCQVFFVNSHLKKVQSL